MSKELEALERIKQYTMYPEDIEGCKIIETALEEKEQQDSVLKILKEVIAFAKKLPDDIKIDDDGSIRYIIGPVSMRIQRQMENQERELLRKWVLEACFPKELKALEIIEKYIYVIKTSYAHYICINDEMELIPNEEYEILDEVLK